MLEPTSLSLFSLLLIIVGHKYNVFFGNTIGEWLF